MTFLVAAVSSIVSTAVSATSSVVSAAGAAASTVASTTAAGVPVVWTTTVAPAAGGLSIGGTLAAIASAGVTAAKVLSGVASIGASLGAFNASEKAAQQEVRAGEAVAQQAVAQAGDVEITRRQEFIASEQRANEIRSNLIRTVGAQRVAFAASGVDISAGTPDRVVQDTFRRADLDLEIERTNRQLRDIQRFRQQQQLFVEARLSRERGQARADTRRATAALDLVRRF